VHLLTEQALQTGLLGQRHHRHQPGTRHEMIVIEHRTTRGELVRNLHPKCLSEMDTIVA
jgi:hypothetical protein